jgi:hypothetical protein
MACITSTLQDKSGRYSRPNSWCSLKVLDRSWPLRQCCLRRELILCVHLLQLLFASVFVTLLTVDVPFDETPMLIHGRLVKPISHREATAILYRTPKVRSPSVVVFSHSHLAPTPLDNQSQGKERLALDAVASEHHRGPCMLHRDKS